MEFTHDVISLDSEFWHCEDGEETCRDSNRGVFGECWICVIMGRFALVDWFCLLPKGETKT